MGSSELSWIAVGGVAQVDVDVFEIPHSTTGADAIASWVNLRIELHFRHESEMIAIQIGDTTKRG